MVTKEDAKKAWQVIMTFSIANSDRQSVSKDDIGRSLQNAIITLNDYFTQDGKGENQ